MFLDKISDFDRRLATIICQGFDDCSGIESVYKVGMIAMCNDLSTTLCTLLGRGFDCSL